MDRSRKTSKIHTNPAQQEAILHGEGPCAVIAGPGSGKTLVLVERVCHLIESGTADPSGILVLTFSRAAAAEMRSRFLKKALSRPGDGIVFGTMHAVFYRILQESGDRKLRLIDPLTKQRYLRHLCDTRLPRGTTPEEVQLLISRFKNGLPCSQKWLPALIREYDCFLENRSCLDFDDMVLGCLHLLKKDPEALAYWRRRFQWFLVDEFQDVSCLQYEVLQLLAAPGRNLFVVGDDDQSIYGFRGADPRTMQRFLADYSPDVRRIGLLVNYRCGRNILEAASGLIRENRSRIDKRLRSGSGLDGAFSLRFFSGRDQEYAFLSSALKAMRENHTESPETVAVIFRTHAGARSFLTVLKQQNILFEADAASLNRRGESAEERILRDLITYYRVSEDLFTSGARRQDLQRILNRPERLLSGSFLNQDRMTSGQILQHAGFDRETVGEFLGDLRTLRGLSPSWSFRYLMDSVGYRAWAEAGPAETAAGTTGSEPSSEEADRALQIRDLLESLEKEAGAFPDTSRWISHLQQRLDQVQFSPPPPVKQRSGEEGTGARSGPGQEEPVPDPDAGISSRREQKSSAACVHVLTMHACKGLEFDTVFIPDLNEGNVPSRRSVLQEQIEEERRLLYVAMTRAKKNLILTCLEGTPDRPAAPSRFLAPFI